MSSTTAKKAPAKTAKKTASKTPAKTTKPRKTAAKPKTPAAAKPAPTSAIDGSAPAAKKIEPTVVDAPQAVIVGPMMRKKELIDTVVSRSGMKKKDVKPVVETMLSVLGEALADNRELVLPPFGKLKVRRSKQLANGRVLVTKIRQSTGPAAAAPSDPTDS